MLVRPYCATGTATVTQTGTAGGTYTAPAGVVIDAATGNINLVASTPGTYTITYQFSVGTCSNTTTTSITITAFQQQQFLMRNSLLCNRNSNCNTDRNSGWNIYCASGCYNKCSDWRYQFATSTPGTYTITYSFTMGHVVTRQQLKYYN